MSSSTTPTGARVHSIPIPTAAGCHFAPEISLEYNSQAGEGDAGFGWHIGGLSSITVRNKNIYYDGSIQYAAINTFRFSLDGIPLVPSETSDEEDEYLYETVTGNVKVKPIFNDMGFVAQFEALFPDGRWARYNYSYSSQPTSVYPITEMKDSDGNSILYSYLQWDYAPYYIDKIVYGPGLTDTLSFSYQLRDTCLLTPHFACIPMKHNRLLRSIKSSSAGEPISQDTLSHIQQYGTWLLKSIIRKRDTVQLNPLRFGYGCYTYDDGEEYYDDAPEKNSLIASGRGLLTTCFEGVGKRAYSRGKMLRGHYADGLIVLPDKPTYAPLDTNIWGQHHYGSKYAYNDRILVYPDLGDELIDPVIITTGVGFKGIQAADIDGDGTDEIIAVNAQLSGDSTLVFVNAYTLTSETTCHQAIHTASFNSRKWSGLLVSPVNVEFYLGDFTGCGKVQVLLVNAKNGDSRVMEFYNGVDSARVVFSGTTLEPQTDQSFLFCYDLDADGKTEICRADSDCFTVARIQSHYVLSSSIPGLDAAKYSRMVACGDLNGDGYIDILYRGTGPSSAPMNLRCCQYTGTSFLDKEMIPGIGTWNFYQYQIMDVNRDGLGDLVSITGSYLHIRINENGQLPQLPTLAIPIDVGFDIVPGNWAAPGGMSCIMMVNDSEITTYKYATDRSKLRLMAWSQDSFGNTSLNEYRNLADDESIISVDESLYSPSAGYCLARFPLNVLSEHYTIAVDDINTITPVQYFRYRYTNPAIHQLGLGFRGFQMFYVEDRSDNPSGLAPDQPALISETTFDPENSAVPVKTVRFFGNNQRSLVDSTVSCYAKINYPYRKDVPRLDTVIKIDSVNGFWTMDRFQYDSLEFVTQHYHVCRALDTVDTAPGAYSEKWTFIRYAHQINLTEGLWLLGNAVTVTEDISDMQHLPFLQYWETITKKAYSQRSHRPDTVRTFVGMTDQIEGPFEAENLLSEIRITHDTHGNVTSEQSAYYGGTVFHGSTYTYDPQGRFLLSETDEAGLTTHYSGYNLFGQPTTVTDPRGNVTSYTYDNWGNLTSVLHPDGRIKNTVRQWAVDQDLGSLYTVTVSGNASPTQTTWYSSLGQELRTGVKRFNGDIIYTDRQYSSSGRLLRESLPYKTPVDTIRWNTTSYDSLGRVVSVNAASGAVTSYSYNGRTTGTTKEGITITRSVGADGNLYSSHDSGGDIQYYYRPDGQPDSVRVMIAGTVSSPVWATTLFTYDAYGRRTSVVDPSAGTRSDTYTDNADGSSSVVHTTANGTVTTCRDYLGRITQIQRHDNASLPVHEEQENLRPVIFNTTYTYNNYGDLLSAVSNNGTSTYYTYDAYGRIATRRENIPGSRWLQQAFSYDTAGRVAATAYSTDSGISVTESYTYTNGYHTATTAMNTAVWQLLGENALGQPALAYTGSVIRRYGYDAFGLPIKREMESAEGATTMDFRYSYHHPTGNMTWREDATREVSNENFAHETFTYDGLNRLATMGDNLLSGSRDVTYSNLGNVTSIDGNGVFYYQNGQNHPYRISGGIIGELAWCQNPNIILGYTSYDRPMYIAGPAGLVEFTYNDAGERVSAVSSIYVDNGPSQSNWERYYIGNQYEREIIGNTTRETLFLGGDAYSAPMVFYRENGTGGALYNLGRDVQGSITHLSSANGTLLQEFSYDPWGRQRDPATHAFASYGPLPGSDEEEESRTTATVSSPVLHRGYCGHEHLEQFGLINMNARLYDPFTGRFYSPDPYVQMPDFSQSFNRYAYCLNNPLKYEDKGGEWIHIIVGAAIGGVGNLIASWNFCHGFWEYVAAFGIGAASGAAVAATGGALAAAGGGFWATVGLISTGAAGGAATSATNDIIRQTGKNFEGMEGIDWNSVGVSAAIGGASGAVSAEVGLAMAGINIPITINGHTVSSSMLSSFVTGSAASAASHIAGGTLSGLSLGKAINEAFVDSFDGLWSSVLIGGTISAASTVSILLVEGINPITGEPLVQVTSDDLGLTDQVARIQDGVRYKYKHDGSVHYNRDNLLPSGVDYTEFYTVSPLSGKAPGPTRIVIGNDGKWYYTPNHYNTYIRFKP